MLPKLTTAVVGLGTLMLAVLIVMGTAIAIPQAVWARVGQWRQVPTPERSAGGHEGELSGVACATANSCMAVGYDKSGTQTVVGTPTLALHWNGAAWTIQATENPSVPAGALGYPSLDAVACPATNGCMAVGLAYAADEHGQSVEWLPLAEWWDSEMWKMASVPLATTAGPGQLYGVTCMSITSCLAVGQEGGREGPSPATKGLLERWNGTTWTMEAGVTVPAGTVLYGASCTHTGATCMAVGGTVEQPIAEHWNGSTWTAKALGGASGDLKSVSCVSATLCIAVGGHLIEHWNGVSWHTEANPEPRGTLNSVSCASVRACTAVGTRIMGSSSWVAVAERWNGQRWTVQSVPHPHPGSTRDLRYGLSSVSCPTTTVCMAVGSSADVGVPFAGSHLTMRWSQ